MVNFCPFPTEICKKKIICKFCLLLGCGFIDWTKFSIEIYVHTGPIWHEKRDQIRSDLSRPWKSRSGSKQAREKKKRNRG